jgi:hypothetical protein
MGGHDQAIEQAQSRNLYAACVGNAVDDGGNFSHRSLPLPKIAPIPKQATGSKSEINSSIVAVAVARMGMKRN